MMVQHTCKLVDWMLGKKEHLEGLREARKISLYMKSGENYSALRIARIFYYNSVWYESGN